MKKPKVVEVNKLHDHLITWKFALERLAKYGFQKPDATVLFDTLKVLCEKMCDKDPEFKFNLQTFIHKNSSVNGIVTDGTVTSFYDMILDHGRGM